MSIHPSNCTIEFKLKNPQKTNTLDSVYIYNIVYCRSSRLWSLPTDDSETGKTGACWLTANEPLK